MSNYYLFRMLYDMGSDEEDAKVITLMRTGWQNQIESEWQTSWEDLENSKGSKVHVYGMHPGYFPHGLCPGREAERCSVLCAAS